EAAAELGEKVVAAYGKNLSLARAYAAPILYQVYPAIYGVDGARESGLLRLPALGQNRPYVDEVANLVKPVAKSTVELFKVMPSGRAKAAKELSDRLGALKSFLEKNVPEDTQFGGKSFPLKAQVAGAAAEESKLADAVTGQ